MAKRHDENKDLRLFSRVGRVDRINKTLKAAKGTVIGIHMWGRIDYLTKYCGWFFIWDNSVAKVYKSNDSEKKNDSRAAKKASKQPKLTDKTKKKK